MSTALATAAFPNLPDHLKGYLEAEHRNDSGSLKPSDFGINMLKVCQGQSREARPGQNGEAALALGTMFLARDRKVIQPGLMFIPLLRTVRYIKWNGRPGEGKMEFSTDNANDRRIVACDGLTWKQDERTGNSQKPLVTEYVNFYLMLQGYYDEPVLLSFSRTGMKRARRMTQDVESARKFGKLPYRALAFTLGNPTIERDKQNEWYQISAVGAGFAPPQIKEQADKLYELACMMRDASTGQELANAEEPDDDEPVRTVQGRDVSAPAQPTVVTPPPMGAPAGTAATVANAPIAATIQAAPAQKPLPQPMQPEIKAAW